MEVQPDFRDLLALFNEHKVEYMIVGGYALAFHGAPRYTGDLDIFVHSDSGNARRILAALDKFGFKSLRLTSADFENAPPRREASAVFGMAMSEQILSGQKVASLPTPLGTGEITGADILFGQV